MQRGAENEGALEDPPTAPKLSLSHYPFGEERDFSSDMVQ